MNVLLLSLVVLAAPPSVVGVENAEPGSLVTLKAGGDPADSYTWVFVKPGGHPFLSHDRTMAFATKCYAGEYIVVLFSVSVDPEGKPIIDSTTHTVHVSGEPNPGPGPDPPPPPPPPPPPDVIPDGKYKLGQLAYDAAKALPTVVHPDAPTLAANFTAVASTLAAGGYSGSDREKIDKANADLATRNRAVVGEGGGAWAPWMSTIGARMVELRLWENPTTVEDHATAYREIATGLGALR